MRRFSGVTLDAVSNQRVNTGASMGIIPGTTGFIANVTHHGQLGDKLQLLAEAARKSILANKSLQPPAFTATATTETKEKISLSNYFSLDKVRNGSLSRYTYPSKEKENEKNISQYTHTH